MKKILAIIVLFMNFSAFAQCIQHDTLCSPTSVSHSDANIVSICGNVYVFSGNIYAWGSGGAVVYNDAGNIYAYDVKISPTSAGGWIDTVCTGFTPDEQYVRAITGQQTNPSSYNVWFNLNNGTYDVYNFQLDYEGCKSPVYSFYVLEESCTSKVGREVRLIYIQGKGQFFYYDHEGKLKRIY
jgi:hypothetical protein